MKPSPDHSQLLMDRLFMVAEVLAKMLLVALTLTVIIQVISRFLGVSIMWTVELSRFLFPWLGLLGVAVASRNMEMPRFTMLPDKLNPRIRSYYDLFINAIVSFFLIAFLSQSGGILRIAHVQRMPLIPLPWSSVYVSVTVGIGLLLIITLQRCAQSFRACRLQAQSGTSRERNDHD